MTINPSDVLERLDEKARALKLYAFDNGYVYPIGSRLHVFSNARQWALVIEILAYNPRHAPVLSDDLECYGDGCSEEGFAATHERVRVRPLEDDPETFPPMDSVPVRDREVPTADLAWLPLQDAFRAIADRSGELLFARDDELAILLSSPVPRILSLDEWRHPDVVGGELPSATSTFRQLAESIADADPTVYQPDEQPKHALVELACRRDALIVRGPTGTEPAPAA